MATYLFSQLGSTSGVGTTRWQACTMERLLVPQATNVQQATISELVNRILSEKKEDSMATTSKEESEIDRLVYQLYDLTCEEISTVEARYFT